MIHHASPPSRHAEKVALRDLPGAQGDRVGNGLRHPIMAGTAGSPTPIATSAKSAFAAYPASGASD